MRLLHTETLRLENFSNPVIPKYAILSHTWGNDEVLFEDMKNGTADQKAGYSKVHSCCSRAAADGYSYVWIDTCCIDKSSSAELSEAINSMFRWYMHASICYAYLEDVPFDSKSKIGKFEQSRWFTRGWTLQELIAPPGLDFYSQDWRRIGTREEFCAELSKITNIDEAVLCKSRSLQSMSIAKRMSWAANRVTTRPEDIAYSLMGVFGANMPLLYGEGETSAFHRLQEEIMKNSTDQSIFAWSPKFRKVNECSGVLAEHPREFEAAANIVPIPHSSEPFQMTNKGLRIQLQLMPTDDPEEWLAILSCHIQDDFSGPLAIRLLQEVEEIPNVFIRASQPPEVIATPDPQYPQPKQAERETVYILKSPVKEHHFQTIQFWLQSRPQSFTLAEAFPSEHWNNSTGVMQFYSLWPQEIYGTLTFMENSEHPAPQHKVAIIFGVCQGHEHFFVLLRRVSSKDKILDLANVYAKRMQSKDVSTVTLDDRTLTVRMVKRQIMGKSVYVLDLVSETTATKWAPGKFPLSFGKPPDRGFESRVAESEVVRDGSREFEPDEHVMLPPRRSFLARLLPPN
jgi:hypothetical protein